MGGQKIDLMILWRSKKEPLTPVNLEGLLAPVSGVVSPHRSSIAKGMSTRPTSRRSSCRRLQKFERGCRIIYAGVPCFVGLGLEDGHFPTFWLLLYEALMGYATLLLPGAQGQPHSQLLGFLP